MAMVKLSPPWCGHYRKIQAMFKYDSDVHVLFDEDSYEVKIYVDNDDKANAIARIMIPEIDFGNIKLKVMVVPANDTNASEYSDEDLFNRALADNDALSFVRVIHGVYPTDFTYIVFTKRVVQYFNDDLGDLNGFKSTLYEDIARDIFKSKQFTYFCTDVTDID